MYVFQRTDCDAISNTDETLHALRLVEQAKDALFAYIAYVPMSGTKIRQCAEEAIGQTRWLVTLTVRHGEIHHHYMIIAQALRRMTKIEILIEEKVSVGEFDQVDVLTLFDIFCVLEKLLQENESVFEENVLSDSIREVLAQFNVGACYYNGEGIEQDYEQAVMWWCKAAESGSPQAQHALGVCYENGYGVTQDEAQTVYWYKKAAANEHAIAQYNLVQCYRRGGGVREAQMNLGLLYETGRGVQQNNQKTLEWYEKAAARGHTDAAGRVLLLSEGRESKSDDAQSRTGAGGKDDDEATFLDEVASIGSGATFKVTKGRDSFRDYLEYVQQRYSKNNDVKMFERHSYNHQAIFTCR